MTYPTIYRSTDTGAPTLNNAVGAWCEVLRVCLQNGYNSKSVTSIVVSSGVATVTCATHGYSGAYASHVLIEGSSEAALNGKKQPTVTGANTFNYPAPGVANGTYTGTITAKQAPAGWTEIFTGTGKSIFQPDSVEATGICLRILDTNAAPAATTYARMIGVENPSDIDTYSNVFPTNAQRSDGLYLQKGTNNTTPKPWFVIANDRFLYLFIDFGASGGCLYWFGDLKSLYAPDPNCCGIHGGINTTTGQISPSAFGLSGFNANPAGPPYVFRDYTGTGSYSENMNQCGPQLSGHLGSGVMQSGALPTWAIWDGIYLMEGAKVLRGVVPGLASPLALQPFPHLTYVVTNEGDVYFGFYGSPSNVTSAGLICLSKHWH
ncbi:hypothetical protein [Hydrogenophaga sp.]|uniref:hypothetical protein n=1 Tax=Hydrogenophaga sp. TaxID=1904254 RepID=UPI00271BEDDA|nr:hypothetical protein [Hydrogenophaga sp.]MDO8903962.1 hypothetical protein [Hydrogenophaga sp.]